MKIRYTMLAVSALMLVCSGDPIVPNTPLAVNLDFRKGAVLEFNSDGTKFYQFEYSTDLENWDKEGYSFKGTGGHMAVLVSGRGLDKAFYRLRDDGDPKNVLTANPSREWVDALSGKAIFTPYVNTAAYEIQVFADIGLPAIFNVGTIKPTIIVRKDENSNWITVAATSLTHENAEGSLNATVPAGWQYEISGNVTIVSWNELK